MRLLFYLFLPICCIYQDNKYDWHLKKNENGIAIYTRKTAASDIKELKSIMYVKTSLNSIVALLNDWESYPKWVYKCGQSTTLKKISSTECVHYQTIIIPWPAENRDLVATIKTEQDEETGTVTISSICNSKFTLSVENYIRITEFNASWVLVPLKDDIVQITYQLQVNPGGSLPAWLINISMIDGPYVTMSNFKEWVVKEKYQKEKFDFIKELK